MEPGIRYLCMGVSSPGKQNVFSIENYQGKKNISPLSFLSPTGVLVKDQLFKSRSDRVAWEEGGHWFVESATFCGINIVSIAKFKFNS